jgi:hypothetical protein
MDEDFASQLLPLFSLSPSPSLSIYIIYCLKDLAGGTETKKNIKWLTKLNKIVVSLPPVDVLTKLNN